MKRSKLATLDNRRSSAAGGRHPTADLQVPSTLLPATLTPLDLSSSSTTPVIPSSSAFHDSERERRHQEIHLQGSDTLTLADEFTLSGIQEVDKVGVSLAVSCCGSLTTESLASHLLGGHDSQHRDTRAVSDKVLI